MYYTVDPVAGELSTKIKGLSEKPKYNKLSPLYSNHPHPKVHESMENIRLWLYSLSPLFEETIIIKFMRDGELQEFGWWKFYFDGVRLTLYVDINISHTCVDSEIRDGLYLTVQAVKEWYERYDTVINTPVKYRREFDSTFHSLAFCAAAKTSIPVGELCKNKLQFAEEYISARILIVEGRNVSEEVREHLRQYPGERWWYSNGTFMISKEDFDYDVLKHIQQDNQASIETTKYWVDRLMAD